MSASYFLVEIRKTTLCNTAHAERYKDPRRYFNSGYSLKKSKNLFLKLQNMG